MSGPQCRENPPTLSSSSGAGFVEHLGGLDTYISGSFESKSAVIFASDVFGYEAPKLRKLADKVAAAGFYVVVPDFFYGDPYISENTEKPIPVWIQSHGTDKGTGDCRQVIAALKSTGILKIGVAGFCWGGKVAVELAKTDNIQAAVLLHPGFVTVDDIKEVKAPIAILGAELDHISPAALIKQFGEVLSAKPEVDSLVKIFPGVVHGWTVRYADEDEMAVKYAEEAHRDMIDWFGKYVN